MIRGRGWFGFCVLLVGCSQAPPPSVPPPSAEPKHPEPAHPTPTPVPDDASSEGSVERIDLVVVEPPVVDAPPHVEVKFPLAGKRIPSPKARDYAIKIKATNWSDDLRLMLILDDFTPWVVTSPEQEVRLGQLVAEDHELSSGTHHLFVAAVRPGHGSVRLAEPRSQAPFSDVEFWIGDEQASAPAPTLRPRVVQLSPRGTYNGPSGENVLVDFRVLGLQGNSREVQVDVVRVSPGGEAAGRLRLPHDKLARIQNLSSGDYQVTVSLLDPEGKPDASPGAVKSRTITVNRDAPQSE